MGLTPGPDVRNERVAALAVPLVMVSESEAMVIKKARVMCSPRVGWVVMAECLT